MGTEEDWTRAPLLPGGEPPCRLRSRQSSVPLEAWFTESGAEVKGQGHHSGKPV